MTKRMTIQHAVEEFELYDLYKDIIESYEEDLEDPSLVSDLYDLIDEYEEEYEFWSDSEGDLLESFERNLRDAITTIVDANEDLAFIDDDYSDDDDLSEIIGSDFEKDAKGFDIDLDDDDDEEGEDEEEF